MAATSPRTLQRSVVAEKGDEDAVVLSKSSCSSGADSSEEDVSSEEDKAVSPRGWDRGLIKKLGSNRAMTLMLVCVPLGFIARWQESIFGFPAPDWAIFTCNFFGILPMAWLIGEATEDLAASSGDTMGALLNATFGNIVEMLLCVQGIRAGQYVVVRCTLVGSMISNLLLVLGTAMIWGGSWSKTKENHFDARKAKVQTSILLLSVLTIALPTSYSKIVEGGKAIVPISRGISVIMLAMYCQYIYWTFQDDDDDDEDKEDEQADMDPYCAGAVLAVCTILTTFGTDYLIDSIEGTIDAFKVSKEFIGVILLPIIGNAAEHWSGVVMAGRDKMDLSLGIAVGSACQMSLFVTPVTVIAAWIMDRDGMSLDFASFDVMVLFLSSVLVSNALKDGVSYGLLGWLLLLSYISIATVYWCESNGGPGIIYLPNFVQVR